MSEEKYAELLSEFIKKETGSRNLRLRRMENAYYIDESEGRLKRAVIRKPAKSTRYVKKNRT
jgi:hypothetical protein